MPGEGEFAQFLKRYQGEEKPSPAESYRPQFQAGGPAPPVIPGDSGFPVGEYAEAGLKGMAIAGSSPLTATAANLGLLGRTMLAGSRAVAAGGAMAAGASAVDKLRKGNLQGAAMDAGMAALMASGAKDPRTATSALTRLGKVLRAARGEADEVAKVASPAVKAEAAALRSTTSATPAEVIPFGQSPRMAVPAPAAPAAPAAEAGSGDLLAKLQQSVASAKKPPVTAPVVTQPPSALVQTGQAIEAKIVDLNKRQGLSRAQIAKALEEMSAQPGMRKLRPSEARKMVDMVLGRVE